MEKKLPIRTRGIAQTVEIHLGIFQKNRTRKTAMRSAKGEVPDAAI